MDEMYSDVLAYLEAGEVSRFKNHELSISMRLLLSPMRPVTCVLNNAADLKLVKAGVLESG